MKRTTYTALLLALTVVVSATAVVGTVGSAVSTQTQTETNTITSCTTITESGTYVLGNNITANRDGCIRIEASDVVLDGNGHTIDARSDKQYERAVVASATGGLSNVTVRDFTVKSVEGDAIRYVGVTDGSVTNVTISVAGEGVVLRDSSGISLTRNTIKSFGWHGISLKRSDDNRIANNAFENTETGTAVSLLDSTGNTITENTATALENVLIEGINASRTVVTDNTVTEKAGIILDGDNSRVANNTLTGEAGIAMSGSNNVVVNNTATNGVSVSGTSNTVVRNEIDSGDHYNDKFGLSISGSGHRIVENTISGGGQDSDEGAAVSIEGRNHTLVRNELAGPSGVVVQTATDTITIRNNDIGYIKYGIQIKDPKLCGNAGAEVVEVHGNSFDGHENNYFGPGYGILNEDEEVVNATGNYWGESNGPSSPKSANGTLEDPETGAPANGSGDAVSEGSEPGVSNVHFYPYLSVQPQNKNENATA